MSLNVPLTVRLRTRRMDRQVTREVSSLTFRSTIPGGFDSATIELKRPLFAQPQEVEYYGRAYVYDGRNGRVAWEGRMEDPGRSTSDGETWSIGCVGTSACAEDEAKPYIAIDRNLDGWMKSDLSSKEADMSQDSAGDYDTPSLVAGLHEGTSMITTNDRADYVYTQIYEAGQHIGRVTCVGQDGITSSNAAHQLVVRLTPTGTGTVIDGGNSTPSPYTMLGRRGVEYTTAMDVCNLRFQRTANVASTGANQYGEFWGIIIRAQLADKSGNAITSGYNLNAVRAHEVVEDVLYRYLSDLVDGPNARVDQDTSWSIDQLAYPDGTTAKEIFDRVTELSPAYYWAIWETNHAGLARFEWRPWDSSVRYVIGIEDGFDSPSSGDGLYNECLVRWKDPKGRRRSQTFTQTVTELDDAGLTRTGIVSLDDRDSVTGTQVQLAAQHFLNDHKAAPSTGTLTVRRAVFDRFTGRMVMPWEIKPGYIVQVKGVRHGRDTLHATDRDGSTTFKIAAVEFRADDNTAEASLELDQYTYTQARYIASLNRRIKRRRHS